MMNLLIFQIILLLNFLRFTSAQTEPEIINVIVCLVQWADHTDRALIPKEQIEQLWNGPGYTDDDLVPGESISEWLESNSYGKYKIMADVVDYYKVDVTEAEASNGAMGNSVDGKDIEDILVPVLANAAANGYDMGKYANSKDELYGVVFAHSGYDAQVGGVDCETGANYLDRIISKSWGVLEKIGDTKYEVLTFVTQSIYRFNCNLKINRIGVPAHEFMHAKFLLEDLYDTGGRYQNSVVSTGGIGAYGIMGYAGGQKVNAFEYPGILCPWHRMEIGALEPIEITVDGIYTARASALYKDVYRISLPYEDGEYLLIENRQPVLSDVDLWPPGGILIWHIDENTAGIGNRYRGGPFLEGWPGNGDHYRVALLQADGEYELEKAINLGHNADFWKPDQVLGPGNGELVATEEGTYPNTDSYVGGNIIVTGLVIDLFTDLGNGEWSFRVQNLTTTTREPTKLPTKAPSPAPQTPVPTVSPSTSASPTRDCIDDPNFTHLVDFDYATCDWMAEKPDVRCEAFGDSDGGRFEDEDGDTVNESCCACGGGIKVTPSPTVSPATSPSSSPSSSPTKAPTVDETPTTSPNTDQCLIVVSPGECNDLMKDVTPVNSCNCYNFCNGSEIDCCPFGNDCIIDCEGELVAGCLDDAAPTASPNTGDNCLVNVNIQDCESVMSADVTPVDDCDCYNFCNGEYVGCCKEDTPCGMLCDGSVVAGCTFDAPSTSPNSQPRPSNFFFWPPGFT